MNTEQTLPISKLKINTGQVEGLPKNPRFIRDERFEKLKQSIKDLPDMLGLRELIVYPQNGHYVTIGGNMRLRAAADLGLKELPCKVLDENTPVETLAEIAIKDNIGFGQDDYDILANEWTDFPLTDWGMEIPEFDVIEDEPQDAEPQIDKAAELNKKWQVKTGDLWLIGSHRLVCGDSTRREDVERLMQGDKASLIWTDPPYGVKYGDKLDAANPISHRVRGIENDDLDDDALELLLTTAFNNIGDHSVKGAALYAACPPGKQLPTAIKAIVGSCFDFRWQLVWVKDQLVLSRADYHFRHENILYGWKKDGSHYFTDDRTQDSIFEVPRPKVSDEHPTMKPIELIAQMILNSSKKGQIVADVFGGSGSTMIAAENTKRHCRMLELTEPFCAVILERMQTAFPELIIERENVRKT